MLPRFEAAGRARPVALVSPSSVLLDQDGPGSAPTPHVAPYAAVVADLDDGSGTVQVDLVSGSIRLTGWYDRQGAGLEVAVGGTTTTHRSRRHGRPETSVERLGLALTGVHLTVFTSSRSVWTARARIDLTDRLDTRDEAWLAGLHSAGRGPVDRLQAGGFGQLGLRDVRQVTHADGSTYWHHGRALLTATSAGPGFFDTAHTSVWSLEPDSLELTHLSDLFFRRPDRTGAYGDHATHLLRDDDRWLVATSTWGDFDRRRPGARVTTTLATTTADLTGGRHLLDTVPLRLPTTGLRSVGVWDPHLVRTGEGWLAAYVSAPRFFRFHPVLAQGPDLESLTLRAAATGRSATEGSTVARLDGQWRVLASDGRDGPRGLRERYPVLDVDLQEVGTLDAPYPSNIPWPTLVPINNSWLLVGFNGTPYGGTLTGYGTHGEVVFARSASVAT